MRNRLRCLPVSPAAGLRSSQTCGLIPYLCTTELSWAHSDVHALGPENDCFCLTDGNALQIVARTGKLTNEWHGTGHLPALLARLLAAEPAAERRPRRPGWAAASGFAGSSSPAGSAPVACHPSSAGSDGSAPAAAAADVSALDGDAAAGGAGRGSGCRLVQHSLWRLSTLFVRLLLTSQVRR